VGSVVKSASNFLGVGPGTNGPSVQTSTGNQALDQLNDQNSVYSDPNNNLAQYLNQYANGGMSQSDLLGKYSGNAGQETEAANALATNPLTGSLFAAKQVQSDPILGGLFGQGGQLQNSENQLNTLENQGFNLTQGDNTLYGQEAGQIANQFANQGNQAASDLANRGMSASGAAGAAFSGIAGNQNQMLANAQLAIGQQRFTNVQNQIAQQSQIMENLGQQGQTAINNAYARNSSGAQNQKAGLENAAGMQNQSNSVANNANLAAANYNQEYKPQNFMDAATSGAYSGIQSGIAGSSGSSGKVGNQSYSQSGSGVSGLFG
jgi:hypothetical protein